MAETIQSIRNLAEKLFPFDCAVAAPENQELFAEIQTSSGADIHRFASGSSFNGWSVPNEWVVEKAEVRKDGEVVFDGTVHPLAVAAYSKSFSGTLSFEELREHVHTRPDMPSAHGYHCMWQYRPWDANWCLCIPHEQFVDWTEGDYEVELITRSTSGDMLVAEAHLEGEREETIVLNAHTCHPRQANDDIVGMAVAMVLHETLKARQTRWSYRIVLGPEHLGTVFYLNGLEEAERKRLAGCYFLEMPGTPHAFKLADSFTGDTVFDRAVRKAARELRVDTVQVPWRCGAGNDETVWEAPGYEIPCVEVSRCNEQFAPYAEYHTSEDTLDRVVWSQVEEFYKTMALTIEILERNCTITRNFDGIICLSHPDYDLYLERPDPSIDKSLPEDSEKWGHLLDCLLRYFDGDWTLLDIAEKHDLPVLELATYLDRFVAKELIQLHPCLDR